jgi:hypothetical protein
VLRPEMEIFLTSRTIREGKRERRRQETKKRI